MTSKELRQKYLEFLRSKGHAVIPSASLIPENDPTTLFTGSGMQPMVPFLLGESHPQGKRIADSQKCFRAQDMEEVGDNRHTTFFEMLGNWSLGDYFKQEQISWMFEFLTKEIGLDPKRLYVTVFRGNDSIGIPCDTETVEIWKRKFAEVGIEAKDVDLAERDGLQDGRIFYYPEEKNWWSRVGVPGNMPNGEPGGPDSEMFWDFGEQLRLHETSVFKDKPCHVNCDCGRFLEIGNNVFMEYVKTEESFVPLPNKNVDFGGGLERLTAASLNNPDVFLISLFDGLRQEVELLSGKKYGRDSEETKAFRVLMDHLRAATFLIGDGALPSNKDQGYFTRRLIRRAIRFAGHLGITKNFCGRLAKTVIVSYEEIYPSLKQQESFIASEMQKEEERFTRTLAKGLKEFSHLVEKQNSVSGKDAFDLFQTFGFPLEMTEELALERKLTIDREIFRQEFKKHQELSRGGAEQKFAGGLADHSIESTRYHTATHLTHEALRRVLGPHVFQKGSNITRERMRFDFSHPDKMTPEQVKQTEDLVNEAIKQDLSVHFEEMSFEEAKQAGAIGLFEDKYQEKIKVYFVGKPGEYFSKEVCGGPHVQHTGQIGRFKIVKEEAVSTGVRRLKAIVEPPFAD